jgi:protein gp37
MATSTAIEWTDATWNPVTGCTKISTGCDNCYAERFSERFRGVPGHPFENGFDLQLRPGRLEQPLRWREPKMIFVNSMSDLFHKEVPFSFIDRVFDTMETAHWHKFQILTKRSSRLCKYVNARYVDGSAPPNVWLGTSIEDGSKKSRARHIQATKAAVRFLSIEPMLGPIGKIDLEGIHWVIVGGERGGAANAAAEFQRCCRGRRYFRDRLHKPLFPLRAAGPPASHLRLHRSVRMDRRTLQSGQANPLAPKLRSVRQLHVRGNQPVHRSPGPGRKLQ